ncbi:MAG: hypothetical protein O2985_02835 [Proteobacteria bacterium]|nr:hypothetical protein [Pseudomonadota bacterium]
MFTEESNGVIKDPVPTTSRPRERRSGLIMVKRTLEAAKGMVGEALQPGQCSADLLFRRGVANPGWSGVRSVAKFQEILNRSPLDSRL